jgi:hypothetical protein
MIQLGKPFEFGGRFFGDEFIHIIACPLFETLCDYTVQVLADPNGLPGDIPSAKAGAGLCTACKDIFARIVIGAR